jgi:tetratricopeptide (TPR) repeat protein/tRNA A-37 threonylcarbamoyl transferase component Bud32
MSEGIEQPSEEQDSATRELHSMSTRSLASLEDDVGDPDEHLRALELLPTPAQRQRLGHYVVLGELGRGGMGTVLEAFDRRLDRRVALKLLRRNIGEEHTKRLLREAQALAKLSHPNVVQVYEVGEAEGQTFIAMELVKGRSLREWLGSEPRPSLEQCLQAYLQAGEGLAAAHARGLVHRDFKPSNAVIDDEGRVRVLDFGLARLEDPGAARTSVELSLEEPAFEQALTKRGEVMGTPGYMAPEQMRGLEVDARTDQFSYCVALYEALYGDRPFQGKSLEALMASMATQELQPLPRGIEVPAALRAAVVRGLASEPDERWPSMAALLVELRRATMPPRKRGWLYPGVGGGLVAIGLGLWQYAEVGYRCEGARAQLEGTWDDARRRAVEAAMLATKVPYAADTWVRVRAGLDAYADAWVREHTEACEATSVREEQSVEVMDLRMACLRERRLALQEAVNVLGQADATRVQHAVALVTGLPTLSRCDDVEALQAELPPPEDPEVAVAVEASRRQLVQASALYDAGAYGAAEALADDVVARAEGLEYVPLLAEALLARGSFRGDLARFAEAEEDMLRAYRLAAEHRYDAVEAKAVARLVLVVGYHQARHEAGLQWGTTALALAKSRPAEPELEASALVDIGTVLGSKGELSEALAHHERALAIYEAAMGSDHPNVGRMLGSIGTVLRQQGRLPEALAYQERALAIFERALGPAHPDVAKGLSNLGSMLVDHGELEAALTHQRRALAILEQALGPDHPDVAKVHHNFGAVLLRQGEQEAALIHYRSALVGFEQALGPDHPDVAGLVANIGLVLGEQGKLPEAHEQLQRALASFERALGPRHPYVGRALAALADNALRRQAPDAAREPAERAVSILESAEASPDELAHARFVLARVRWLDPSRHDHAVTLAERARDGYATLGDPAQEELAEVELWLAEHPAP